MSTSKTDSPTESRVPRLAVTTTEAAQSLGASVNFFEDHIQHELRIVRKGRRRLIPVRELERWPEANASRVLDERRR